MFTETFPILSARDLDRSLAFYVGLLDAEVTYRFPPDGPAGYVSLSVGGSQLGLGLDPEAPEGPGRAALWVYAEDCDAAVDRLRAAGVHVLEEPVDQPWGERVSRVVDPDGNQVVVGQRAP